MSNASTLERSKAKKSAARDIQNRIWEQRPTFWWWEADYLISTANFYQTQQQNVAKKVKNESEPDQETLANHIEDYRKSEALIPLKQKQYEATFPAEQTFIGKTSEEIRCIWDFNEADYAKKRQELQDEISRLEENLVYLNEKINVIKHRLSRLQEKAYNDMGIIENKCNTLLAVYDDKARKTYIKIKLPTDPFIPIEPPTMSRLRQVGLLNYNKGDYMMSDAFLITTLDTSHSILSAPYKTLSNHAQLSTSTDIDENLNSE